MNITEQVTNCIRALACDMVQKANSGHPGAPMGMAPVANVLWSDIMKYNPKDSHWPDRDRFVLSNGHACALQYIMLHLTGYELSMDDLMSFRQLQSKTPGHPERGITDGVELTTGPLGQGVSNAVGLAIAEKHLAAIFNKSDMKIVDHYTYVFLGDGCLMEGVTNEALSLAGHLGLNKLILIYDSNKITIDGSTDITFTETTEKKYIALGLNVITVEYGNHDYKCMRAALKGAQSSVDKPTMIILKTTIGFGSKMAGTAKVHGAPLGEENIKLFKEEFNCDPEKSFYVGSEVYKHFKKVSDRGAERHQEWSKLMEQYKAKYPVDYKMFQMYMAKQLPDGWKDTLPKNDKSIATRKASENTLSVLMPIVPWLIGGSADLTGSNLTLPSNCNLSDFQYGTPKGRYIRFGVREHAMAAILNGVDAHGGLVAYGGTFLNFIGYALGSVRLSAMCHHQSIYVATHDSIGLGEDGPTHQPIELIASLRATPNMHFMRPADQVETSACWALALESTRTPSVIALSRQNTVPLTDSSFEGVYKGAYAVLKCDDPQLIILSTGSEVGLAMDAAKAMSDVKVRVVSFPIWDVFEEQPEDYKNSVLTEGVPVVSVEPYASLGWERYSHCHVGIDRFGMSAPAKEIYAEVGLTTDNVVNTCRRVLQFFAGRKAFQKRLGWANKV